MSEQRVVIFEGPAGVKLYRALAIASGLEFYARTGTKINSMYTPKNMMLAADDILGVPVVDRRDYSGTALRLREWAEAQRAKG